MNALWMPGMDHAGIATQNVVEQELAKEGLTRHDLGREKFIERVWEWKAKYGGVIIHQLKRLGCSCDWARERFTMDEGLSKAVREVFVRLYNDGLIYQGDYIVNWCPRCRTAISDLEVEYHPEAGHLWSIRYPFAEGEGGIVVATTRPETMLGDTAVAVNPNDERYRNLIGKEVILPLMNRRIPIIADDYVTMEFGSGAVKITPASDPNDFAMAGRHGLADHQDHGRERRDQRKRRGLSGSGPLRVPEERRPGPGDRGDFWSERSPTRTISASATAARPTSSPPSPGSGSSGSRPWPRRPSPRW